jgi:hypothetical protein
MCNNNNFITLILILGFSILIFYQSLITLIIPLRVNILLLIVEFSILLFLLFKLLWPR